MERQRRAGGVMAARAVAPLVVGLLGALLGVPGVPGGVRRVDSLPTVDPGLFVILGVRTCGGGGGYCLLGTDCTLDRDFASDEEGHCDGLRFAFTPAAHFSCCRYVERSNATLPGEPAEQATQATTEDPAASGTAATTQDDAENVIETEILVKPNASPDQGTTPKSTGAPASTVVVPNRVQQDVVEALEMVPLVTIAPPPPPQRPLGPASGQTLVAVSEEYKVQGGEDVEEEAEVVAVAGAEKEVVLVTPACRGGDVNPCWRSSFRDRAGVTLCSGTLVGVDAAVTTAMCATRLLEAGPAGPGPLGVTMRLGEQSLAVRDVAVHEDYVQGQRNDIAVVRLLLDADAAPSTACRACLPANATHAMLLTTLPGKTCFALAARLNGVGLESSAVCAGKISAVSGEQGGQLRLSGCEVATLKSALAGAEQQALQAVRAREGAAILCDGALVGLASTALGSYSSLAAHMPWISRTLAATRTSTFRV